MPNFEEPNADQDLNPNQNPNQPIGSDTNQVLEQPDQQPPTASDQQTAPQINPQQPLATPSPMDNTPNQQQITQENVPKKSPWKIILFLIILLILIGAGVWIYKWLSESGKISIGGSNEDYQTITVKVEKGKRFWTSVTCDLPKDWTHEAFFPMGMGATFWAFPNQSAKDKTNDFIKSQMANRQLAIKFSEEVQYNYRAITTEVVNNTVNNRDLSAGDKHRIGSENFDQAFDKNYSNSRARCWQWKKSENIFVTCDEVYLTNIYINLQLHTYQKNYNQDLKVLDKIMETIKVTSD